MLIFILNTGVIMLQILGKYVRNTFNIPFHKGILHTKVSPQTNAHIQSL